MAQLEYGDYYKFTASAGIALVAGAVIVPWMFLREPFDVAMEASKIALLTTQAQDIVHTRQFLVALAIHKLPLVSSLMAAAGVALTAFGLYPWRSRQTVRDRTEDLENEKRQKELGDMSPVQIEAKSLSQPEPADEAEPVIKQLNASSSVASVLAVEQAVLGRIISCMGSSAQVLTNKRLGNVEFDAIISTPKTDPIIVEIKYIRRGFNRDWILTTMTNLALRMAVYSRTFAESARGVVLIVIATSNSPLSRKAVEISRELKVVHESQLNNVVVRTIEEADIATIDCAVLRQLILD